MILANQTPESRLDNLGLGAGMHLQFGVIIGEWLASFQSTPYKN